MEQQMDFNVNLHIHQSLHNHPRLHYIFRIITIIIVTLTIDIVFANLRDH